MGVGVGKVLYGTFLYRYNTRPTASVKDRRVNRMKGG